MHFPGEGRFIIFEYVRWVSTLFSYSLLPFVVFVAFYQDRLSFIIEIVIFNVYTYGIIYEFWYKTNEFWRNFGLWSVASGLLLMPLTSGFWSLIFGFRSLTSGLFGHWSLASSLWSLASGLWLLALWSLISGLWSLGSGLWSLVFGLWPLAFGLWSLGSGLWSLGSGLWTLFLIQLYKMLLYHIVIFVAMATQYVFYTYGVYLDKAACIVTKNSAYFNID